MRYYLQHKLNNESSFNKRLKKEIQNLKEEFELKLQEIKNNYVSNEHFKEQQIIINALLIEIENLKQKNKTNENIYIF
jgi:hypothetical protein